MDSHANSISKKARNISWSSMKHLDSQLSIYKEFLVTSLLVFFYCFVDESFQSFDLEVIMWDIPTPTSSLNLINFSSLWLYYKLLSNQVKMLQNTLSRGRLIPRAFTKLIRHSSTSHLPTVYALSTHFARSAIGVVRISGSNSEYVSISIPSQLCIS